MNPFEKMCTDEIFIQKNEGKPLGPFKVILESNKVIVFDTELDVAEGDKVIRHLPNGKTESYTILEVRFQAKFEGIPSSYDLILRKDSSLISQQPTQPAYIDHRNQGTIIQNVSHSTIAAHSSNVTQSLTTNPDTVNILSQIEAIIRSDRTKSDAERQEALQTIEDVKKGVSNGSLKGTILRMTLNGLAHLFPSISEYVKEFLSSVG